MAEQECPACVGGIVDGADRRCRKCRIYVPKTSAPYNRYSAWSREGFAHRQDQGERHGLLDYIETKRDHQ